MIGQLRSLTAFQENLGSVPITYIRQLPPSVTPYPDLLSSGFSGHQVRIWDTNTLKTNKNSLVLVICSDSAMC